jgi:hypothetical protein
VFPVMYELDFYILFIGNSVFEKLTAKDHSPQWSSSKRQSFYLHCYFKFIYNSCVGERPSPLGTPSSTGALSVGHLTE